jgi:hypothetical protein
MNPYREYNERQRKRALDEKAATLTVYASTGEDPLRLRFVREDIGVDFETCHDGSSTAHEEERRIGALVLTLLGLRKFSDFPDPVPIPEKQ